MTRLACKLSLVVAVALGALAFSATPAHAQVFGWRRPVYVNYYTPPAYYPSTYSNSYYYTPTYTYTPSYYTPTYTYTPSYYTPATYSSYYYTPTTVYPAYYTPTYPSVVGASYYYTPTYYYYRR
jgi:hypothetical protein